VGEESLDFGLAHVFGVAFTVKQDEAPGLVYISVLGAEGVVRGAAGVPRLVEELFGARGIGQGRAALAAQGFSIFP